ADAFRQFSRLRARLPKAPVVIIAGNHDSPRAVETGSILRLLAEIPGVTVVDQDARAVRLEELDTTVLCLPHNALASGERIALEPDPDAAVNILMLHGTVAGGGADEKLRYVSEYGGVKVEARSEERRVGKECRSRWAPKRNKEKKTTEKVETRGAATLASTRARQLCVRVT